MKNRNIYWRRYKDNDASVPFKVGTLGPHTVLPITISYPVLFSWISPTVWNLFPFKGDFSFGKNQKSQGTNSGLKGNWLRGWFDVLPKNSAQTHSGRIVVMKRPIPCCPWLQLLNHPNSFYRGMFKLNTKSDADLLLYSLSHFECDTHTVHMLNQGCLLPPTD